MGVEGDVRLLGGVQGGYRGHSKSWIQRGHRERKVPDEQVVQISHEGGRERKSKLRREALVTMLPRAGDQGDKRGKTMSNIILS